jgi:hypothetical protein
MNRVGLVIGTLVLAGCASTPTVSENQCRAGDWQTIGYGDGMAGRASTRLLMHQDACGEFGIVPLREEYMAGWQDGLRTYCTAGNGFHIGQRGGPLNQVCSGPLRDQFAAAHADGRRLYQARRDVQHWSATLAQQEDRLHQIKQEIIGVTTAQLTPDLSAEERVRLLATLEDLADERAAIKNDLPNTQHALREAELHLADLDQAFAAR